MTAPVTVTRATVHTRRGRVEHDLVLRANRPDATTAGAVAHALRVWAPVYSDVELASVRVQRRPGKASGLPWFKVTVTTAA